MRAFIAGWFCSSLGARSLAGGITREPVRRPTVVSAKTSRVPWVGEYGWRFGLRTAAYCGVCTMCTLLASD